MGGKVVASPTKTTLLSRNMLSKTVRINTQMKQTVFVDGT